MFTMVITFSTLSLPATLNFLKLCKIKFYNYCLVHNVQVMYLKHVSLFVSISIIFSHLKLIS